MRKNITTIIVFLLSLPLAAQQNYASISFGASLPQGNYSNTGDLAQGGYARTGGAIKFDAGYFPVNYFGIGASFAFGSNYAERDSLLIDMIRHIEENAESHIDIPEDAVIQYGTGFWNNVNLFIGPLLSFRATQIIYFDLRVLGGLSILRAPDQKLHIAFEDTEITSFVSNQKMAFGFTAGAGIRFKLSETLALRLAADYSHTRAHFDYDFELFREAATGVPVINTKFPVQTIEALIGLAYSF